MTQHNTSSAPIILSIDEARACGFAPLTVAALPNLSLHVDGGARRIRYLDWLMTEQERITQSEERHADIVDEGNGRVSLWVY